MRIFKILLICWLILSFTRTLFNFSKLITEEPKWFFLNNEEKKEKQFGEKHVFYRFLQKYIPDNSNILLYTNDGMVYYLSRYYLYPTTVIWGERQYTEWKSGINRKYSFVAYFPIKSLPADSILTINQTKYTLFKIFIYNNLLRGAIYKK